MRFALEAMQAHDGDCLLLHYEPAGAPPVRVLIDGGSQMIFQSVIKPRIDELRGQAPLDLRMAIVSHIDADHITGILDLFKTLAEMQDDGKDPVLPDPNALAQRVYRRSRQHAGERRVGRRERVDSTEASCPGLDAFTAGGRRERAAGQPASRLRDASGDSDQRGRRAGRSCWRPSRDS